jgi:CheY-like chemotaxis protein
MPSDLRSSKGCTTPQCWQAENGQNSGSGKVVLVVDDEPAIRGLLKVALEKMGFTVLLAADSTEALDVYGRWRPKIALVLLDVRLPGLDGPQTLAALQRFDPALRCCFMTGHAGNYSDQDLLARGALRVFTKPVPLPELVTVIEQLAHTHTT